MRKTAFWILLLTLPACAIRPQVVGETTASPRLQRDTLSYLRNFIGPDCSRIDKTEAKVLHIDKNISSANNTMTKGKVVENWTLSHCGKTSNFEITFIPDGQGGAYFTIRKPK